LHFGRSRERREKYFPDLIHKKNISILIFDHGASEESQLNSNDGETTITAGYSGRSATTTQHTGTTDIDSNANTVDSQTSIEFEIIGCPFVGSPKSSIHFENESIQKSRRAFNRGQSSNE
jgi:hypothetical protein